MYVEVCGIQEYEFCSRRLRKTSFQAIQLTQRPALGYFRLSLRGGGRTLLPRVAKSEPPRTIRSNLMTRRQKQAAVVVRYRSNCWCCGPYQKQNKFKNRNNSISSRGRLWRSWEFSEGNPTPPSILSPAPSGSVRFYHGVWQISFRRAGIVGDEHLS